MTEQRALRRVQNITQTLGLNVETTQLQNSTCSIVAHVPTAPPNEIFNTAAMFTKDTDSRKVNLGIGAYRDNTGKPWILPTVRKAEDRIHADGYKTYNHEYLGIAGYAPFFTKARELMFGATNPAVKAGRIATVQTLSGTGSLSLGADFISQYFPKVPVYLPVPTWGNHDQIFSRGTNSVKKYRYWDEKTRGLDFKGMIEDLKNAPDKSVILMHACAHNPTGVDPTVEQWKEIARVCKAKKHVPYFDCAYQGFATGSLENDAFAVRYFTEQGFELFVSQSFAKNFGLYDTRTGALSVVCETKDRAEAVASQLEILIRATYSNPPAHGARIVATILNDKDLTKEWHDELTLMSGRIRQTRTMLVEELKKLGTPGDWSHITSQIGMFSYTGLNKKQCEVLVQKHHIYLLLNGRISMAGINTGNVKYLAQSIDDVVRNVK